MKTALQQNFRGPGKLNVSEQCALAAMKTKHALVCVSSSTASKLRKVTITINSALMSLNLSSQYKTDITIPRQVQGRAMTREELEHVTYKEMLRTPSSFHFKRRRRIHLIAVFNYLTDKAKTEPDPLWRCSAKG